MEYANERQVDGAVVRSLVRFKKSQEYDALLRLELRKAWLATLETSSDSMAARRARLKIMTIQAELQTEHRCAHTGLIVLPRA